MPSSAQLQAWGVPAHRAIAELAQQRLSARTGARVADLLGTRSLAAVAVWADDARETTHRHTDRWHFVNIPWRSARYEPRRDCRPTARGDCIIAALERLERDLARTDAPPHVRREALMFVVHLVGDLHQPLHASDGGDRGGNDRPIAEIGGATNLHAAWDVGILRASRVSPAALVTAANAWLASRSEPELGAGTYTEWALESFALARLVVYPQVDGDGRITRAERQAALAIIEQQIARAGVRLAAVLNRAL